MTDDIETRSLAQLLADLVEAKNALAMRVASSVRIDAHGVIAEAVERGAATGVRRAFKYAADVPDADAIIEHVEREVMNALCDVLKFDDERTPK